MDGSYVPRNKFRENSADESCPFASLAAGRDSRARRRFRILDESGLHRFRGDARHLLRHQAVPARCSGRYLPVPKTRLAARGELAGRISMLIFSVITVMQFLAFGVAYVVVAGIRRSSDSCKLKLRKLENADIFFDVPLYVGLFGTVSAFLVMTFSPQSTPADRLQLDLDRHHLQSDPAAGDALAATAERSSAAMKSARAASEPGNSHRHLRLSGVGDVVDDDRHGAGACRRQRRRTRRPDHCAAALRTAESGGSSSKPPGRSCAKRSRRRDFPRRGSRCSRSSPGSSPTRCLKANNSKNGSGSPGPIPVRSRRSSFNRRLDREIRNRHLNRIRLEEAQSELAALRKNYAFASEESCPAERGLRRRQTEDLRYRRTARRGAAKSGGTAAAARNNRRRPRRRHGRPFPPARLRWPVCASRSRKLCPGWGRFPVRRRRPRATWPTPAAG